jgi:predicted dehydrogenase
MKKVGIGVLGSGSVAEIAHFPSIREIPQAELVAACDINEELARRGVEKWGAKVWFRDYQEMLKRDDIDLVIIATPNYLHREQAIACAEAGKHVLIEKPFACTNKEAWDIVDAAKKRGVKVMVGCNYRFWPQNLIVKDLLQQKIIGEVTMGRSQSHETWDLYHEMISYTKFRQKPEQAGAGALFDLGSHMVDLLRWLMGREAKSIVGIAKNTTRPVSYTPLDDTVYIEIEFEGNAYGMVSLNRFSPAVSQGVELSGTEGTIFVSSEAQNPYQSAPLAIYLDRDYNWEDLPQIIRDYRYPQIFWALDNVTRPVQKRWVSIYPPRGWAYKSMIEHFVQCILEDREPMITGEDGARVMEILCAVFKSMETRSWVDLPLKEEVSPPYYKPRRP